MELYLVQNQDQDFEMGTAHRQQLLHCRVRSSMIKNASSLPSNKLLFDKFQKDFTKKFGTNKEWTIVLEHLSCKTPGPSSMTSGKELSVKGELLKELHQYFHGNNTNELLRLEVNADCFRSQKAKTSSSGSSSYTMVYTPQLVSRIEANDFTPRAGPNGSVDHSSYVQRDVAVVAIPTLTNRPTAPLGDRWYWSTTIRIKISQNFYLADILPNAGHTAREIFETKKFPDFAIISEDGTRISCHKVFLAKSPVLTQMLEEGFEEARTNEMTMGDMTTQGVKALLEFLYCGTVNQAMTQCDIALELLKAADMYDLPILWKAIATIIPTKPHTWFDVDVALRLFVFVNRCMRDESKNLMRKMMQVVGLKPEKLSTSAAFKELFPGQASRDMFLAALTSNRP